MRGLYDAGCNPWLQRWTNLRVELPRQLRCARETQRMLSELDDEKMLVRAKEAPIHVHSHNVYDAGADQESGAEATGEQLTQADSPGIDWAAPTVRHLSRNCRHAGRRHCGRRPRRMTICNRSWRPGLLTNRR
jgi:hypothetical protein